MEHLFEVSQLVLLLLLMLFVIRQSLRRERPELPETGAQQFVDTGSERSVYDYSAQLEGFYNIVAHPDELAAADPFKAGVALLCQPETSPSDVLRLASGDNLLVSCMAMEALGRRSDCRDAWSEILNGIGTYAPYSQYFGLKLLMTMPPESEAIISRVLSRTTQYMDSRLSRPCLQDLIRRRHEAGEDLSLDPEELSVLNEEGQHALRRFLNAIDPALGRPLLDTLGDVPGALRQSDILNRAGRVWEEKDAEKAGQLVDHRAAKEAVAEIKSFIVATQPQ